MECQPIWEVLIRQESGIPCRGLLGVWPGGSFFDFPSSSFHHPECWGSVTMSKQCMKIQMEATKMETTMEVRINDDPK